MKLSLALTLGSRRNVFVSAFFAFEISNSESLIHSWVMRQGFILIKFLKI